jgi:predicted  nucleic acid-binding Zn-ribbon protein
MGIDLNKDLDKKVLRRISNVEERIKDILTAQKQFSTASQLTELLAAITLEIETLKEISSSLERRVSIIEDNPDL